MSGYLRSFTESATFADFIISQRCQPEAFADYVRFDFKCVLGASFEEAEEVLDNRGGSVMALKVYEAFAVDGWGIDEGRLLSVIYQIAGIDA